MRRRSEAAGGAAKSATGTETFMVSGMTFVVCPCGLKQSASMVLKSGLCIGCGKALAAPEGTEETYVGNLAAEQAAKHKTHVPLGTPGRTNETRVSSPPLELEFPPEDAFLALAGVPEEDPFDALDPTPPPKSSAPLIAVAPRVCSGPSGLPKAPPAPKVSPSLTPAPGIGISEKVYAASFAGEEVTATWAEEAFQVEQFCTVRVGPFTSTSTVQPGETRGDALARVYAELRAEAERERPRKIESFVDALVQARKNVKQGSR